MKVFIGIDDTDNLETRGTGHQARTLGMSLMEAGLFELITVTRHQLLVDRRIPFTSHNSSACLYGECLSGIEAIISHSREFLLRVSAFDADAGLCVATAGEIDTEIIHFGRRAKKEILTLEEARSLADKHHIFLDGYLNTKLGMIGSLAGVGLRAEGDDGRLLWIRNLRETRGVFKAIDYLELTGVERMIGLNGDIVPDQTFVNITEWCRPVMKDGMITLYAEKSETIETYEYQSASKEFIKSISE